MIDIKNIKDIDWTDKKVTIIGYGKSGIAAAKLCEKIGCELFISDSSKKNSKKIKI